MSFTPRSRISPRELSAEPVALPPISATGLSGVVPKLHCYEITPQNGEPCVR